MKPKHSKGPECEACNIILEDAHEALREWYKTVVKPAHPDCHISWSFRDKDSQDLVVAQGKSKLSFPHSPHNFEYAGKLMALAIDLFQIMEPMMIATWSMSYFEGVMIQCMSKYRDLIAWGGGWNSTLHDYPHFELKQYKDIMSGKIDPDTIKFS